MAAYVLLLNLGRERPINGEMAAFSATPPLALAAGTIVTSDYLPWARVLANSFAAHHRGVRFAVLILDQAGDALRRADDGFELLFPEDVGLDSDEYGWMRAIYDGFELSCAVKPWLLRHLLEDAAAAFYFDSDILICSPLDDIARRAAAAGLLLTPHTFEPPPPDGLIPDEDTFLRLGQFNAGFIAVGAQGRRFLDWWGERLRRHCVAWSPSEPLRFVDQRWLDLAVNYFSLDVLRDPGANVAYWNLWTRPIAHGPGGYLVDGEPLRFMHFSGFDPANPDRLSRHLGDPPRIDATRSAALQQLCAEYAASLAGAGLRLGSGRRAVGELAPGIWLTTPVRAAVRAALLEAERLGTIHLPDPTDHCAVHSWLRSPVTAGGISWYLWGLWASHPGIRSAFAAVPGPDEQRLLAWSEREGAALELVPTGLAGRALRLDLDGARSFVALVDGDELANDCTLLAGIAECFNSASDVTLLIHAPGRSGDALERQLEPLLTRFGLDGPASPDLLGMVTPAAPGALAPLVHAVLTHHRRADPALRAIPHVTDAAALRRLVEISAPARETEQPRPRRAA